ncbi:hypothetical protein ABW19_dt0210062 [Dactylella cylindrospora]|nr:hypothetical protein ABW19_dt0210062 [Dactylella cylindrospora]
MASTDNRSGFVTSPTYELVNAKPKRKPVHPDSIDSYGSPPLSVIDEKLAMKDGDIVPPQALSSGMNTPLLNQTAPMTSPDRFSSSSTLMQSPTPYHRVATPSYPPPHDKCSNLPNVSFLQSDTLESYSSLHHKTANVPDTGLPLPRFTLRAALSIFIPLIMVLYYYLTYLRWLRFPEGSSKTWIRRGYLDNVAIINYSWFVLATFALNLGTYCVAGSVAAMVMRRRWAPLTLRRLIVLAGNTFQDPAGWINAFVKAVKKRSAYSSNGLLWDILAFFSIIGFAAWPLTGLTMQTMDGFSIRDTYMKDWSFVVGRNFSSINGRDGTNTTQRATEFWSLGFTPQLPLRKQIYVPEGSSLEVNVTDGNVMPDDASESIFLPPQAQAPIMGVAFGLLVRYNCSIVNSTSEFTILNRRNETLNFNSVPRSRGARDFGYLLDDDTVIFLRNKTRNTNPISFVQNVNASLELGTSIPMRNITDLSDGPAIGYTAGYPGIDQPVILEAALWQNIASGDFGGSVPQDFAFRDAENDIAELRDSPLYPGQKAVGVRCMASSALGTANINGVSGTYRDFTTLAINKRRWTGGIKRFENGIPFMILQTPAISSDFSWTTDVDWFSALYASIEKSSQTTNAFGDSLNIAPGVLQAKDLRNALLRAHKTWATHIMYDGLTDPTYAWRLENVTIGEKSEILTRGVVLPEAVLAMLSMWALSIIILAAGYQFRRRWTETLDGYTIFRFGVDRPDDILPEQLAGDIDTASVLEGLPGMVGDIEPHRAVGYIGLVKARAEVNWDKKFG